jgi:hypothetical protein
MAGRGNYEHNLAVIEDCVQHAKACMNWSWIRGSRLFFWQFDDEFLTDMRDGVEFWHLGPSPKALPHKAVIL